MVTKTGTIDPTPADPLVASAAPCVKLVELTRSHTALVPLPDEPDLAFGTVTLNGMMSPVDETLSCDVASVDWTGPVV